MDESNRYPAFVDGERGAYGVTFPDLPGVVAMGKTMDEAFANAEEALRDHAAEAGGEGRRTAGASPLEQAVATARGGAYRHSVDPFVRQRRSRRPAPWGQW